MNTPEVAGLRQEYTRYGLRESDLHPDPIEQFTKWFNDAVASEIVEPNILTLATASADGFPSARTVLLKGYDARGFVFYTNQQSRKGRELAENPRASLVFWWDRLERQVVIQGTVTPVPDDEADDYFHSRPRGSQLGAWASRQSTVIESREVLERRLEELEKEYEGKEIPRPEYWGGYVVKPLSIEFWQGRPNRLHDRLRYRLSDDGAWIIERLSP
jgi:pyridoxamine 5'-phosphate oxidase